MRRIDGISDEEMLSDMQPKANTAITLIGHTALVGYLTGRIKSGRRCDYWQCYWTFSDGGADNTYQWVPRDQILIRPKGA